MLQAFAELFAEGMSEVRLEGYLAALEDVPTEALGHGLQRAAQEAKFFPSIAEIRLYASWEWGRRWRERCPHQPTCPTPTRCELEQDRDRRRLLVEEAR